MFRVRMTEGAGLPAVRTSRPLWISLAASSLLVRSPFTSMPIIRPMPRVAPRHGRSRASMRLRRYAPFSWTDWNMAPSIRSST